MNNTFVRDEPIVTIATITGILGAAWSVIIANELLWFMRDLDSLNALVYLLLPILAAIIQRKLVTPVANPKLPAGTEVNRADDFVPTTVVQ